jgi:hypothetical protein
MQLDLDLIFIFEFDIEFKGKEMKSSSEVCIAIYISCRRKEDFGVKSTLEYSHLAQQLVFPFGHHHFSPKQVPLEFVRRSNSAVAQVRPKTRDDCCFMRRMR